MSAPDTYCDLPPLPDDPAGSCEVVVGHEMIRGMQADVIDCIAGYSAEQMHSYARAAIAASSAKLPSTPEEVIEFIGPHFDARHSVGAKVNWRYKLSVHDLLHAFNELRE